MEKRAKKETERKKERERESSVSFCSVDGQRRQFDGRRLRRPRGSLFLFFFTLPSSPFFFFAKLRGNWPPATPTEPPPSSRTGDSAKSRWILHRPFERAADRRRRAGRKKKGCTERANEKERTAPLPPAPPAPSGTAPPPSRLVAAYHTSVKRHSTPAMKSPIYVYIYIHIYIYAGHRSFTHSYCTSVCAHRGRGEGWTDDSRPCLARPIRAYRRIIYSNGASLAAPTATRPDRPTDFRHHRPYVHLCFLLFFLLVLRFFFFFPWEPLVPLFLRFYFYFFFFFGFGFGLEGRDWGIFFFFFGFSSSRWWVFFFFFSSDIILPPSYKTRRCSIWSRFFYFFFFSFSRRPEMF